MSDHGWSGVNDLIAETAARKLGDGPNAGPALPRIADYTLLTRCTLAAAAPKVGNLGSGIVLTPTANSRIAAACRPVRADGSYDYMIDLWGPYGASTWPTGIVLELADSSDRHLFGLGTVVLDVHEPAGVLASATFKSGFDRGYNPHMTRFLRAIGAAGLPGAGARNHTIYAAHDGGEWFNMGTTSLDISHVGFGGIRYNSAWPITVTLAGAYFAP